MTQGTRLARSERVGFFDEVAIDPKNGGRSNVTKRVVDKERPRGAHIPANLKAA
jgi:hypothetical protein